MARPCDPARKEARQQGARFYCGPPCHEGHPGERYTSTGVCRACVAAQPRPDRVPLKPRAPRAAADALAELLG